MSGRQHNSRNNNENSAGFRLALALLAGIALAVDAPTKDGLWSIHSVNTMTRVGNVAPRTTEMTVSRCQAKGAAMQGSPESAESGLQADQQKLQREHKTLRDAMHSKWPDDAGEGNGHDEG